MRTLPRELRQQRDGSTSSVTWCRLPAVRGFTHIGGSPSILHGPNRRWIGKLGRNDQLVQYRRPEHKPAWMSGEEFEKAPEWITVRWTIETNLRSLKTVMGLERVRCKTLAGVQKELAAYLLVYNVVRLAMLKSAELQKVELSRVSFAGALAWIRYSPHTRGLCGLRINPHRPGRVEPRRIKKKSSRFPGMHKPRNKLRQEIIRKRLAV